MRMYVLATSSQDPQQPFCGEHNITLNSKPRLTMYVSLCFYLRTDEEQFSGSSQICTTGHATFAFIPQHRLLTAVVQGVEF